MLPKKARIDSHSFSPLLQKGSVRSTEHFSIRFIKKTAKQSCFSIVPSKKVAKTAVERNLLKRRGNEAIKLILSGLKNDQNEAIEALIFPRAGAQALSFKQYTEELRELLKKANFA